MNMELSLCDRDREDVLKEKLITCDNYLDNKENFIQNVVGVYLEYVDVLNVYDGVNVEGFFEEVVCHNFNICYEIALLYFEDDFTLVDISDMAESIYHEIFGTDEDTTRNADLFAYILYALSEIKYSYSIELDKYNVLVFQNCQNTLLKAYSKATKNYMDSFGYSIFDACESTVIAKGGKRTWEIYQPHLIGKQQ